MQATVREQHARLRVSSFWWRLMLDCSFRLRGLWRGVLGFTALIGHRRQRGQPRQMVHTPLPAFLRSDATQDSTSALWSLIPIRIWHCVQELQHHGVTHLYIPKYGHHLHFDWKPLSTRRRLRRCCCNQAACPCSLRRRTSQQRLRTHVGQRPGQHPSGQPLTRQRCASGLDWRERLNISAIPSSLVMVLWRF